MKNTIFKALSNITRVKILACLGDSDKSVTQLIGRCDLSQSAVSQHLDYLKNAGLIESKKEGRERIYKVLDLDVSKLSKKLIEISKK
jgi:ArsR family transcriptional regulator